MGPIHRGMLRYWGSRGGVTAGTHGSRGGLNTGKHGEHCSTTCSKKGTTKTKFQPPHSSSHHTLTDHVQVLRDGPQLGCEHERDRMLRHMGKGHWHSLMHVTCHSSRNTVADMHHRMDGLQQHTPGHTNPPVRPMPAPTSAPPAAAAAAAAAPAAAAWTC